MTRLLLIIIFNVSLISCNIKQEDSKSNETTNNIDNSILYIKTVTATGLDSNQVRNEKMTSVTTEYFEVGLEELANDSGLSAQKQITEATSVENFKVEFFIIVNKAGEGITFKTTTEFLNFMAGHGYEMVEQTKKRYGTDYTFKKI
jgi:hypothetical protein